MKELPKVYDPKSVEDEIYKRWEESGFLNPDNINGEPYSIMMPPPNVTGVLHLGHSLENSLMDVMARYQRMNGKKVLLLPGTDHAAVATQAKVEKVLMEQGIKNPREELGREKLLEEIKKYAENSKATILKQIRKMGTSCDWSRLAYTFDEKRSLAVNTVFKKMYDDGLIYRGKRMINWDPKLQTTISDDEIVWQEEKVPFYYLQYGPFVIATARPETKFGDKYVVMHPDDKRYKKYKHGEKFECEWINGKITATVIKDEAIDPAFGTGVMTITPWHDMTDFEIAERHDLNGEQIIGFDGKLLPIAGEFAGLDILEARPKIAEKLQAKGLVVKIEENYVHRVAKGDRSNGFIEPQIKEQWFVGVNKKIPGKEKSKEKSLKELMHDAVTVGHNNDPKQKITIIPEHFEKIYFGWIENLRDWCISRQIWWGHRIPVWYKGEEIYCGTTEPEGEDWQQDSDTLDTWFSSGLWTFSTLGWPNENWEKTFHPTNWMQMGYEILFFWMARMILMSTYTIDQIPFRDVYIHGILRDEKGKKFSKSSGNNLDPIEIIDKYGCDALRLSLLMGVSPGNDSRFYEEKVENCRNFVNKLWNVARYIISNQKEKTDEKINNENQTPADKWILSKLESITNEVTSDINNFRFSQATGRLYDFTWSDFADWYLEIAKYEENKKEKQYILNKVFKDILKLWHPFMPFVTEHIWSLAGEKGLLIAEPWPKIEHTDLHGRIIAPKEADFDMIRKVIVLIRNARIENNIEPGKKIRIIIDIKNQEDHFGAKLAELIPSQETIIKSLRTGVEEISYGEKIENAIQITIAGINIYIPLEGSIDTAKEKEKAEKEIANLEKIIAGFKSRLENKDFVSKAPAQVINQQKETLSKKEAELQELKKHLSSLK